MDLSTMTPVELTDSLVKLRNKRKEVDNYSAQLKEAEEEIQQALIMYLDTSGMTTAKFAGVARIELRSRDHGEITDFDKLGNFILDNALQAKANGSPVTDALSIFQRRVTFDTVKSYMEAGYDPEQMGLRVVSKKTLSVTKV